ncbi:MAG: DUF2490 domain-containing protein [Sphingobium sp.]|nr:DUF2490 domain-containing protein [Sphingobium sp.]
MAQMSEDQQVWVNLTAMGSLKDRLVYFAEVQPRSGDGVDRLDQLLLRGAVGLKLSPALTVYQGYAHVIVPRDAARDVNEERSFQQISWQIARPFGGELSGRTRFEQRWRSDGDDMGLRLRQMIRFEKPLRTDAKGPNALLWTEPFIALNDTDWGARAGFDRVRSFGGLELPLGGASTAEIGYLNEYINQTAGRSRMNHIASITLFFRH